MKKSILLIGLVTLAFTVRGQVKVGAHLGLPGGSVSDAYSVAFGVDTYLMMGKPDAVFKFGLNASFLTYRGDELDVPNQSLKIDNEYFLPLALAPRLNLDLLTLGLDVGYAVPISDDGGFYFKGALGFDITRRIELDIYYQSITVIGTIYRSYGLGLLFEL